MNADKNKIWIARIINKELSGKFYCFTEDKYPIIFKTLKVPDTSIFLDEPFISVDGKTCQDLSFLDTIDPKYIENDDYIIKDDTMTINGAAFCSEDYNCLISDLIMCLGIVIKHEKKLGIIAAHYMTGEDKSENDKLLKILEIMEKNDWTWENGARMTIYRKLQSFKKYEKEQDKSIENIKNTLNVTSKIEIRNITESKVLIEKTKNN